MSETNPNDNALIRNNEDTVAATITKRSYDPTAKNRFEFNDGEIIHIFGELTDDRYIQWLKEMNVRGNEDAIEEDSREASCRLWDDVIDRLENVEFDGEANEWKQYVPFAEKVESINTFLAVGIVEPERKPGTIRRLGPASGDITITTEAWFNGEPLQQTHTLRAKTFELEKKYVRIQQKRFKQDQTKGFRKQGTVTYIPQDEAIGQLYDEMKISESGFAQHGYTPLRFKTAVIHHAFESKLDPKK